jgi:hypothetical protein
MRQHISIYPIVKVGIKRGMLVVAHIESDNDVHLATEAGIDGQFD